MKCEHGIMPWWDCEPCRGSATFGDDPIAPYVDENIGPDPVEITTRGQRRAIMRAGNLEYKDLSSKRRGKVYVDLGR